MFQISLRFSICTETRVTSVRKRSAFIDINIHQQFGLTHECCEFPNSAFKHFCA